MKTHPKGVKIAFTITVFLIVLTLVFIAILYFFSTVQDLTIQLDGEYILDPEQNPKNPEKTLEGTP